MKRRALMKSSVNFDQYSVEYAANWPEIDRNLRETTPVAWTDANGGYWIVARHADAQKVLRDWETFTSENDIAGTGNGGKGILIPRNPFQFALSESDPPQATTIRNFETPFFVAKSVASWEASTRQHADEALDAVIETGNIDFVEEYCVAVPAKTVMKFAGIPLDEWEMFALSAKDSTRYPSNHPQFPHKQIAMVQELLHGLVAKRRNEPLDDIVSVISNASINGAPMSDEMAVGVLSAIVFGGFDTATTTVLNALLFLNDKPELREAVKSDPMKMSAMVEEILRLFPPGHGIARTAVKDIELGGQHIKAGDSVYVLWSAANRDPAKFERPDELWLERPNAAQHLSFGYGVHRCLGSVFAKMEVTTMIKTVLERIGDYRIVASELQRNERVGLIDGFISMPARFTPSARAPREHNGTADALVACPISR
jgi:cytochrome P450